jgi:hypothetical protein
MLRATDFHAKRAAAYRDTQRLETAGAMTKRGNAASRDAVVIDEHTKTAPEPASGSDVVLTLSAGSLCSGIAPVRCNRLLKLDPLAQLRPRSSERRARKS